jgi:uncharacterized phage-associated protein
MPRAQFNEQKATQVAARLLKAAGGSLEYFSIIKMMYFADREALLRWGVPITNDRYYSLAHGPVLSQVKDLVDDRGDSFWHNHISPPNNYKVSLTADAGNDQLSEAEEELIDEIFRKNERLNWWGLREKSHELPEWKDPEGSSIRIEIRDILRAAGIKKKDREKIEAELNAFRRMEALPAD